VLKPVKVAVLGALAVGLVASGCSRVGESQGGQTTSDVSAPITVDFAGNVKGPAAAVAGARAGGTITVLKEAGFEHLCPQQIYVSDALAHGQLFHRTLTGYIETNNGANLQLVGDLATSAGETTDNGKTWKYTLRDNVKFDDGSAITSKEVALGIARSFGDLGVQGPQYIQGILDPTRAYKGPTDANPLPPGVTTPDPKTIIFTLPEAHQEWPYLLTFTISTPVKTATDTPENCDTNWPSSGPYKRKEYQKDVKLVLEKNTNWDPNSDPIRHQYPDEIVFEFGPDQVAQTNRLKNPSGADMSALMDANVAPELISDVKADAAVMQRVHSSATPFASYVYINTSKVTDVKVRQALNYSLNRDALIKAYGGTDVAQPATTLLAPVVPGYKKYDAYAPSSIEGDVEKAKELLGGQTPRLVYCFANTALNQTIAATNMAAWQRAGFTFAQRPIDAGTYYTTVGDKTTECQLIAGGWAQDYPHGDSTLGVLWDGTKIVDKGNNNLSYFNEPSVNAKIQELRTAADPGAVASQYGDLDQRIMTEFAPAIPLRYIRNFTIAGPSVGNTWQSPLWAHFSLVTAYVKA
jgi:peptide/nickel transport system substrate-binding protein